MQQGLGVARGLVDALEHEVEGCLVGGALRVLLQADVGGVTGVLPIDHLGHACEGVAHLLVDEAELASRREGFEPLPPRYKTGVLAKYTKLVQSAAVGAVCT